MFERFTERARQVVVLSQDEARAVKHNYIGTEHLLLGLLREEEGLAARVLVSLGLTTEEIRAQIARIVGVGDEVADGKLPFTPRCKKVLELALREALSLGHNYIGTEHILLGLVRDNEGVASRMMLDEKITDEVVRSAIFEKLSGVSRRVTAEKVVRIRDLPSIIKHLEGFSTEMKAAKRRYKAAIELIEQRRFRTLFAYMESSGWTTCDNGVGVYWSHPKCKMPNSTKLSQVPYTKALDIQNRWETWELV